MVCDRHRARYRNNLVVYDGVETRGTPVSNFRIKNRLSSNISRYRAGGTKEGMPIVGTVTLPRPSLARAQRYAVPVDASGWWFEPKLARVGGSISGSDLHASCRQGRTAAQCTSAPSILVWTIMKHPHSLSIENSIPCNPLPPASHNRSIERHVVSTTPVIACIRTQVSPYTSWRACLEVGNVLHSNWNNLCLSSNVN